jgi:hypothetical protein
MEMCAPTICPSTVAATAVAMERGAAVEHIVENPARAGTAAPSGASVATAGAVAPRAVATLAPAASTSMIAGRPAVLMEVAAHAARRVATTEDAAPPDRRVAAIVVAHPDTRTVAAASATPLTVAALTRVAHTRKVPERAAAPTEDAAPPDRRVATVVVAHPDTRTVAAASATPLTVAALIPVAHTNVTPERPAAPTEAAARTGRPAVTEAVAISK